MYQTIMVSAPKLYRLPMKYPSGTCPIDDCYLQNSFGGVNSWNIYGVGLHTFTVI